MDEDLVRVARVLVAGDEGWWRESVEVSLPAAARRWARVPPTARPRRTRFAALDGLAIGRYVLATETAARPASVTDARLVRYLALWDPGAVLAHPTPHSGAWKQRERAAQLEHFRDRLTAAGHAAPPVKHTLGAMPRSADPVAAAWHRLTMAEPLETVADDSADPLAEDPHTARIEWALTEAFVALGPGGPGWPPPVDEAVVREVRERYEQVLRGEDASAAAEGLRRRGER